MRGKKHSRGGIFGFWGGREQYFSYWRLYWAFLLLREIGRLYYWFLAGEAWGRIVIEGAPVAGSFGLGGQESLQNPEAREPKRPCS
jgi:hypothetical protein